MGRNGEGGREEEGSETGIRRMKGKNRCIMQRSGRTALKENTTKVEALRRTESPVW